jgi:hypothetical protein
MNSNLTNHPSRAEIIKSFDRRRIGARWTHAVSGSVALEQYLKRLRYYEETDEASNSTLQNGSAFDNDRLA